MFRRYRRRACKSGSSEPWSGLTGNQRQNEQHEGRRLKANAHLHQLILFHRRARTAARHREQADEESSQDRQHRRAQQDKKDRAHSKDSRAERGAWLGGRRAQNGIDLFAAGMNLRQRV